MRSVKVYLVGAGPGRPDLITVRGLNILRAADVIVYDYLVDKGFLEYAKEGAELICCDKLASKGKFSNGSMIDQDRITDLVIRKARQGRKVIRLKNGDPSIFSRCSQELEALAKAGIEFEIVPGVTAASAAACLSGIPLTDRRYSSSCIFVTGHEDPKKKGSFIDWKSIARNETIVLYMAVENLSGVVEKLFKTGKDKNTPIAIVQNAGQPTQKVLTGVLGNIAAKAKRYKVIPPAIVIVGKVASLEKNFNWLRKSKRILFTGLSKERFFINGTYFHLPLIKIEPLKDYTKFDNYLGMIRDFDWIVFASRYGVEHFFKRLNAISYDARMLRDIKIAAVGSSTKDRLLDFGVRADLVPKEESSKGLLERFEKEHLEGKKVFLPRSDISDKGLEKGFKKLGANVTTSFAYRNVVPKDLPDLDLGFFNEIMFTSPSTVRNLKRRYGRLPKGIKVSCIGDVTLEEAKKCKLLD